MLHTAVPLPTRTTLPTACVARWLCARMQPTACLPVCACLLAGRSQTNSYIDNHKGEVYSHVYKFLPLPLDFVGDAFIDNSATADAVHLSPGTNSE